MTGPITPERAAELLALAGFTEGPLIVQGFDIAEQMDGYDLVLGCVNRSYGARSHEYSVQRRSDPAVAANARLWAAAPDLHALARQQAAEIERLRSLVARQEGNAMTEPKPSYDMSIHQNPDALAWTRFFRETHPDCNAPDDVLHGWFANAMMAMHDHLCGGGPLNGDMAEYMLSEQCDSPVTPHSTTDKKG